MHRVIHRLSPRPDGRSARLPCLASPQSRPSRRLSVRTKRSFRRVRIALLLGTLFGGISPLVSSEEADPNVEAAASPDAPLRFEEKLDGKCYILSSGGKLVLLHNDHAAMAVRYRLVRMFAGRPQMGRAIGTLEPGDKIKLGCSEVDGRRQHWEVERMELVAAKPPETTE